MNLTTRTEITEGPLPVSVISGSGHVTFASVDLNDVTDLHLYGAGDCDRLIIAVTDAKRMLEMRDPHGYEPGAGRMGYSCARCGLREKSDIHVTPCADVAEHTGVTCDLPKGHDGRHEHRRPGRATIVWGPGVTEPEPPAAALDAADVLLAAAELDRSIREGVPAIVGDDERPGPGLCGAERDGRYCRLNPHEDGEHDSGGWRWSDVPHSVVHRHTTAVTA